MEANILFKNKNSDGTLNISGKNIKILRSRLIPRVSQRGLADKLQLIGADLDKNAIQKIESGKRFITDIELKAFSTVFNISTDVLLDNAEFL